jgi:ferric iron reductase protein FhuF
MEEGHVEKKLDDHIKKHDADVQMMMDKIASNIKWFVAIILIPTVLALIAWGNLRATVENSHAEILKLDATKANRETVDTQYNAILASIASLKDDIKQLVQVKANK